jgi:hypothetical protein
MVAAFHIISICRVWSLPRILLWQLSSYGSLSGLLLKSAIYEAQIRMNHIPLGHVLAASHTLPTTMNLPLLTAPLY